jgi:hypothetical protein
VAAAFAVIVAYLTLSPAPVAPGEVLRFVIPGDELLAPTRQALALARHEPGATLAVRDTVVVARRLWIETDRGFVEAARVDRRPPPLRGTLPAGEEGMAEGRVLPDDYRPHDLVALADSLKGPDYVHRPLSLREGAAAAFTRMIAAAAADGVEIRIVSGYRTADYQRRLYERAVESDPYQRVSAPPGRSEHLLGTAADVVADGDSGLTARFAGSDAARWLGERAAEFGIVATFSEERHEARAVDWEPWHLRWVGEKVGEEAGW